MKTVKEEADSYCNVLLGDHSISEASFITRGYLYEEQKDAFIAGYEFARSWYEIEFDKDGFVTDKCNEDIVSNTPVILKDEDGYMEVFHEITKEIKFDYKFWRPI